MSLKSIMPDKTEIKIIAEKMLEKCLHLGSNLRLHHLVFTVPIPYPLSYRYCWERWQLTLFVQWGVTSFSLNFFSNQIQCRHVFLIRQFPKSSNLKQSYFIADETRDFPCIAVLPENSKSAPSVFWSALLADMSKGYFSLNDFHAWLGCKEQNSK